MEHARLEPGKPNSRLWSICSKISRSPRNVVAGIESPFKLAGSGYAWSEAIRSGRGGWAGSWAPLRLASSSAASRVWTSAGSRYQNERKKA